MAIDYGITARELVKELGGDDNIINVTHCATRLRFILKDTEKVNSDKVRRIPGVITTVIAGGQYQVVIGNHVKDAYEKVLELVNIKEGTVESSGQKVGIVSRIIDVISSIFAPFLYTLAACGILQGILGVLIATGLIHADMGTYKVLNFISWTAFTFLPVLLYTLAACGILQGILGVLIATGLIHADMGTYKVLNFISWTAFTFLPVLIAITASKKFKVNEFIAVVIACALVSPDYISMVNSGEALSFLGINIQMLSYTSSVISIILAIWMASYVEQFFTKILPTVIRNLFTPMFTIAIMVPLTLLVFGPFGSTVGGAIGGAYNFLYNLSPIAAGVIVGGVWQVLVIFGVHWGVFGPFGSTVGGAIGGAYNFLYNLSPIAAGVIVGGVWQVLVIFGVHWGITPVTVGNYATLGYDTFTGLQASAVFGQAGATLGVFLKAKDKEMKQVSLPAAITAIFGITEPAMYGVNLRLKKPMICGCIAGAIGGGIAGAFNAYSWAYNMPGIATIPAFFKEGYMSNFIGYIISIIVSFVIGVILTVVIGFKEDQAEETKETDTQAFEADVKTSSNKVTLSGVVKGKAVSLTSVSDEVFASEAMGKGVGIMPSEGKLYAPCDGTVEALFPTHHAIGLTSKDGVEVLLHIGVNTVSMEGKGFEAHVTQGKKIKKGDLLITFSMDAIKAAGYDTTVMMVVTNTECYSEVVAHPGPQNDLDQTLLEIVK